jgi:hypothetical protein
LMIYSSSRKESFMAKTKTPDVPRGLRYPAGCMSGAGKKCFDKGYAKGLREGRAQARAKKRKRKKTGR